MQDAAARGSLVAALLVLVCSPVFAAAGADGTGHLAQCLQAIPGSPLNTQNYIQVVLPDGVLYQAAKRSFNTRVDSSPAAVFYAYDSAGVSAAVKCAAAAGVQVTPAAGRQGFQGASIQDGYLVVDVSNITQILVSADKTSMIAGAGNANVMLVAALKDLNMTDVGVTTGVCSFVGIGGFNSGGGFGPLGRSLGLGCDNLLGLEMVLANGSIVNVNASSHPDLFWASCGGGGGTFGIVTHFNYKLSKLPNEGKLTVVEVQHTPGIDNLVAAFNKFQTVLPTLDHRFGGTYDMTGARFSYTFVFLGPPDEALSLLEKAGLLEDLDKGSPADSSSLVADKYPYGLKLRAVDSYYNYAAEQATMWVAGAALPIPWGDTFTPTPENVAFLEKLMRGEDGLRVVGGEMYNTYFFSQSRLVGPMSEEALRAVATFAANKTAICAAAKFKAIECLLSISGHVLTGAYSDKPADATAYPHRDKYVVLDSVVSVSPAIVDSLSPEDQQVGKAQAAGIVDEFARLLESSLGSQLAAYVNYMPDSLDNWQQAFFGPNYPRLQQVKAMYDPQCMFNKAYTVEGNCTSTAPPPAPSPAPSPPAPRSAAGPPLFSCSSLTAVLLTVLATAAGMLL